MSKKQKTEEIKDPIKVFGKIFPTKKTRGKPKPIAKQLIEVSLDEFLALGASKETLADLFIQKLGKSKNYQFDNFDYWLLGVSPFQDSLIFAVQGNLSIKVSQPEAKKPVATSKTVKNKKG